MKVKNYPDINKLQSKDNIIPKKNARVSSNNILNVRKDRRTHNRISTNIEARFLYGKRFYAGKITNISESGMFIHTEMILPRSSNMEVIVMIGKEVARLPVTVRRTVHNRSQYKLYEPGGIGVELHQSSPKYLSFVNTLKVA